MRRTVLSVLVLASCAGGKIFPDRSLKDFRGIIHCHSRFSHDSEGTYEEILAAAKAAGVDFVVMTDHPPKGDAGRPLREGWRGVRDGVLFIQGAEYAGDNLLGLGLVKPAEGEGPAERIRSIHAQGGVAIVSHPEEVKDWSPYRDADGMEIYNVHAALKKKVREKGFLPRALKAARESRDRMYRLLHDLDPAILAKWDDLNRERRWTGIAGNDAHQNVNVLGLQLDPYDRAFNFVHTHVLATRLTENAILSAIKEGRCYVQFSILSRASFGPDGLEWIGGTYVSRNEVTVPGGLKFEASRVKWIREGRSASPKRLGAVPGTNRLIFELELPAVHRAVVMHPGEGAEPLPWILTNPVGGRR